MASTKKSYLLSQTEYSQLKTASLGSRSFRRLKPLDLSSSAGSRFHRASLRWQTKQLMPPFWGNWMSEQWRPWVRVTWPGRSKRFVLATRSCSRLTSIIFRRKIGPRSQLWLWTISVATIRSWTYPWWHCGTWNSHWRPMLGMEHLYHT